MNPYADADANKLLLQVAGAERSVSLEVLTTRIRAAQPAPAFGLLDHDVTFRVAVEGTETPLTLTAATLQNNLSLDNLVEDLNAVLAAAKVTQVRAAHDGQRLLLASVEFGVTDLRISDAEALGFDAVQEPADNAAVTELGLEPQAAAAAQLRFATIQEFTQYARAVGRASGFAGAATFQPNLALATDPATGTRSVEFNLLLGGPIDMATGLDFVNEFNLDVGQLQLLTPAPAQFTGQVGIELTVGMDLLRSGACRRSAAQRSSAN